MFFSLLIVFCFYCIFIRFYSLTNQNLCFFHLSSSISVSLWFSFFVAKSSWPHQLAFSFPLEEFSVHMKKWARGMRGMFMMENYGKKYKAGMKVKGQECGMKSSLWRGESWGYEKNMKVEWQGMKSNPRKATDGEWWIGRKTSYQNHEHEEHKRTHTKEKTKQKTSGYRRRSVVYGDD